MFVEQSYKIRDILLFLLCCSLPFNMIPKILNVSMIGGPMGSSLFLFPSILLFAYTAFTAIRHKDFFLRADIVSKFMVLYFILLLTSAINGVLVFPHYDVIGNGEFLTGKFGWIMQFLQTHQISADEEQMMKFMFIIRTFKNSVFQCIYTFFFSYLIFCWYKNSWQRAWKIILHSIQLLSVFIIAYAIIEILYYWGSQWARDFLVTVNPIFLDIGRGMGWYPPLLWGQARLRSLFSEPSYLGMYIAFALPFLWANYIQEKRKLLNLGLIFSLWILSFLTYSKTSIALCLSEFILFLILYFFCHKCLYLKKCTCLILAFVCGFGASVCIGSGFHDVSMEMDTKSSYTENYVKDNMLNIFNESSGSNNARFSVIRSELKIWEHYPMLGVGIRNRDCYIADFLTEEEKKNEELANCIKEQSKQGMLMSGFPSPCEYSADLAETGILGTMVKGFPFAMLILGFIKRSKRIFKSDGNIYMVTVVVAMAGCLLNGFSNHLTVMYTTWILLGIAFVILRAVRDEET